MTADQLFQIANTSVLPAWLLLLVLPRWRWTQVAVISVIVPLLSILYAVLLIRLTTAGGGFQAPDFSSIDSIQALMSDRYGFLAGWVHYLAFDLFVGAWIARDSKIARVPHLLIVIPLFLTFMAGPFGLILYLVMRQIRLKTPIVEPLIEAPVRTAPLEQSPKLR